MNFSEIDPEYQLRLTESDGFLCDRPSMSPKVDRIRWTSERLTRNVTQCLQNQMDFSEIDPQCHPMFTESDGLLRD